MFPGTTATLARLQQLLMNECMNTISVVYFVKHTDVCCKVHQSVMQDIFKRVTNPLNEFSKMNVHKILGWS